MPNRRAVREGERFKCPYPGCKRSFAELWRLKVHYRAPPDVRGSGKERGHGQELAQCPQCGARLLPGKHHIQCSGARPKRGEPDKNGKAPNGTAATASKTFPVTGASVGVNGFTTEQLNSVAQTGAAQPGVHVHAQWAGAKLGQSQAETAPQQLQTYTHFSKDGLTDTSWPPQGYILSQQPQQQSQPLHTQQQQHRQHSQPQHPGIYGRSYESVQAVPQQVLQHMHHQHAPVQYTNTFVREAVPGNANAAHCSLQTDLCGAVWPLHQPFPIIASSMIHGSHHPAYTVLASAQAWGANGSMPVHLSDHAAGGMRLQNAAMQGHNLSAPSATLADSNLGSHSKASHLSAQSTVAAMHMHGGMMPTPDHEVGAAMGALATAVATSSNQVQQPVAENAAAMNHQQQQQQAHRSGPVPIEHAAGLYQQPSVKTELAQESRHHSGMQSFGKHPSPPASPPPELVDLPFDFGKFDDLEGAQSGHVYGAAAHSGQSVPADHALNEMDSIFDVPAITDSEDLFKIFTHDNQGNPMITSHIHQRHSTEDPSDHDLEFVTNMFPSKTEPAGCDGDVGGGSDGDCRMAQTAETESTMGSTGFGSYLSALGVASTS